MVSAISDYCRQTGQLVPDSPGAFARGILESLAFKYRVVMESLESLTGNHIDEIRIVGGGSRNRLLNQFTADATGCTVIAGPVEATALGNIAMQMLATGAVGSLAEARRIIDRSFPVERFEPHSQDAWLPPRIRNEPEEVSPLAPHFGGLASMTCGVTSCLACGTAVLRCAASRSRLNCARAFSCSAVLPTALNACAS